MKKLTYVVFLAAAALTSAETGGPRAFNTPEEARDALIQAASAGMDSVRAFFGPAAAEIVRTGDEVEDKNVLERFKRLAAPYTTVG